MKQLSRSVVFVDTNPKHERIAVLKNTAAIEQLEDDDDDVFQKSLIDRYQHRPHDLDSMCLADFAANYVTSYKPKDQSDVLPPSESETTSLKITLTDGFGKMNKRKREAVIRFRKYNKDTDSTNYCRSKLMLYYPWRDENRDLISTFATYEEHYNNVQTLVLGNETKYNLTSDEFVQYDEEGPPEHLWADIAPSTEENRTQVLQEEEEQLTHVAQEDIDDNSSLITQTSGIHARFESAANKQELPAEEYRKLLRELNQKQKEIVMFHRNWCKRAVIALKTGKPVKPYRVFLSGPGGVGKSHVIRLIQSDTIKLLKLSGMFEPGDVVVLLTAPTGVAAFNISGMTLHSALLLGRTKFVGFQPLSNERLNTLRYKLSKLMLIIIDEVSMVGSNTLLEINKRLQQIKGVMPDVTFGGVSVLAVGDLYQLPPIAQPALFDMMNDCYARLYGSGSLWVDEFKMIELDEVMRQRGDTQFIELLCRMRTAQCTSEDFDVLKTRIVKPDSPNYPNEALHVYRLNKDVDYRNDLMLNRLASKDDQYFIEASDSIAGQTRHIDLSRLSNKRSDTGGLHAVLKIAIGARVMLTTNVNVSDGLVNGARGVVVDIVCNANDKVTNILVVFDNSNVGVDAIHSSPFRSSFPRAVPLNKCEVQFPAMGKRGAEVTRLQFPLTLSWATTIHKVQGLTLDEIVVDMQGRFSPGQAYVACSRVKSLEGLFILNYNSTAIKQSDKVTNEMVRLSSHLLKPVPYPNFRNFMNETTVTIALLNVRSISAKLSDISIDTNIQAADIICFCETWLLPSEASPCIKQDHVILRCDRANDGVRGGGVMISMPQTMKVYSSMKIISNGIESILVTLTLYCNITVLLSLIYRPPNVPLNNLIDFLSNMISQTCQCNLPIIILGDFNEDLVDKPNSPLLILMENNGFSQLVSYRTTDRGTVIDHIYIKNLSYMYTCTEIVFDVSDTYYSDHDTIYCTFKF